ncbi:hypothetical protein LZ189_04040, partial [Rhodovulum sulfidophilum]|nr:hypothetical protein [Rhodovulum sulfidophilum]
MDVPQIMPPNDWDGPVLLENSGCDRHAARTWTVVLHTGEKSQPARQGSKKSRTIFIEIVLREQISEFSTWGNGVVASSTEAARFGFIEERRGEERRGEERRG